MAGQPEINTRTYYYLASRWIVFLCLACFMELIAGVAVVKNWSPVVEAGHAIFPAIGLALIAFFVGGFGLLILILLFTSRVVLSDEGIQYHTGMMTMEARWEDLEPVFWRDDRGKHISLRSSEPKVRLSFLARHVPWDFRKGVCAMGIPISEFGGFSRHRLFAEIRQHAPDLNLPS